MGQPKRKANRRASVRDARSPTLPVLRVRAAAGHPTRGWLTAPGLALPVALGRGGIVTNKREGDGATPRGTFHPLRIWWRGDRLPRPASRLPIRRIALNDAWCEDPADRRYNRPIKLKGNAVGDRLRREDHLYDLIVEIDHNTRPRIAGRGSAVFLHIARDGFAPTAGCVAMTLGALTRLIARLGPETRIEIG
jgi:L,D-peptidoglycan transpeptidase YkuD (ErfK/YbiS/YcfS/YnhG family)